MADCYSLLRFMPFYFLLWFFHPSYKPTYHDATKRSVEEVPSYQSPRSEVCYLDYCLVYSVLAVIVTHYGQDPRSHQITVTPLYHMPSVTFQPFALQYCSNLPLPQRILSTIIAYTHVWRTHSCIPPPPRVHLSLLFFTSYTGNKVLKLCNSGLIGF